MAATEEWDDGGGGGGDVGGGGGYWWWAAASTVQLAWGIHSYRRGYAGDSRFMPLKAFAVAALFVGATATTTLGILRASGIHSVKDAKELGTSIRTELGIPQRGIPPRARDE